MKPVNEKHLRQQKLDEDGRPLINRHGHENSAFLTENEIQYVEYLIADGMPIARIAKHMETTRGRIEQIRDNKEAHDRMILMRLTSVTQTKIDAILSFIVEQSEQIDDLIDIQNKLLVDSRKMNKALYLKQIGEAKHRKEIRNLKAEREELRKLLHKKTGIDVGTYKRDVD